MHVRAYKEREERLTFFSFLRPTVDPRWPGLAGQDWSRPGWSTNPGRQSWSLPGLSSASVRIGRPILVATRIGCHFVGARMPGLADQDWSTNPSHQSWFSARIGPTNPSRSRWRAPEAFQKNLLDSCGMLQVHA